MRVRLTGFGGESILASSSPVWSRFVEALQESGIRIVRDGFGSRVDGMIGMNHSGRGLSESLQSGVPISRRILVLWEPRVVYPKMYQESVVSQYGAVYSPSPHRYVGPKTRTFDWISVPSACVRVPSVEQLCRGYMINGNKFSFVPSEMYSFRRRVVSECRSREVPFDLWGTNWDAGPVEVFKRIGLALADCVRSGNVPSLNGFSNLATRGLGAVGPADDKLTLGSRYRVGVVVENQTDYVSEKLFDVLDSGSVAIFVGPPLRDFGLDGAAIEVAPDVLKVVNEVEQVLEWGHGQVEAVRGQQSSVLNSRRARGDLSQQVRDLATRLAAELWSS